MINTRANNDHQQQRQQQQQQVQTGQRVKMSQVSPNAPLRSKDSFREVSFDLYLATVEQQFDELKFKQEANDIPRQRRKPYIVSESLAEPTLDFE